MATCSYLYTITGYEVDDKHPDTYIYSGGYAWNAYSGHLVLLSPMAFPFDVYDAYDKSSIKINLSGEDKSFFLNAMENREVRENLKYRKTHTSGNGLSHRFSLILEKNNRLFELTAFYSPGSERTPLFRLSVYPTETVQKESTLAHAEVLRRALHSAPHPVLNGQAGVFPSTFTACEKVFSAPAAVCSGDYAWNAQKQIFVKRTSVAFPEKEFLPVAEHFSREIQDTAYPKLVASNPQWFKNFAYSHSVPDPDSAQDWTHVFYWTALSLSGFRLEYKSREDIPPLEKFAIGMELYNEDEVPAFEHEYQLRMALKSCPHPATRE